MRIYMSFWLPYYKIHCARSLAKCDLQTVLEPAFGLGVFSRALLSKKNDIQIKGFEIDNLIFEQAKKEFSGTEKLNLLLEDYTYNDWHNKYDGIICNPPYFKFHDYDNKGILREIETKLRCKLNGFTNLYTLFLLKSIHQFEPNGRCAYIIPSEFLNSDYGKLVKTQLLNTGSLRHIIVIGFEENVFDDALTTASIILCANDDKTDEVQFTNVQSISDLSNIENLIENYPKRSENSKTYSFSELNPEIKWKAYYQSQNGYKFKNLVPFSTYSFLFFYYIPDNVVTDCLQVARFRHINFEIFAVIRIQTVPGAEPHNIP